MLPRRRLIELGASLGASTALHRVSLAARMQSPLIEKIIPSSGERIPVIGLGSWRTFNVGASSEGVGEAREVIRLFHSLGGRVIDTAPSYGRAEAFLGTAMAEIGATDDLFVATKVNVEGQGEDAAFAQMENSARVLGKRTVELMQVWNLGDSFRSLSDRYLEAHLDAVREWKSMGRARYIGITTSFPRQYGALEAALNQYELDFVQLDYSIGDREPETRLLPLARDRGVAVLVNRPFTTGNLFSRVAGRDLPPWTANFDCHSWAQFFLKFIVSHPAVTATIPATRDPEHLVDNMGGGRGRLPDEAERRRMVDLYTTL